MRIDGVKWWHNVSDRVIARLSALGASCLLSKLAADCEPKFAATAALSNTIHSDCASVHSPSHWSRVSDVCEEEKTLNSGVSCHHQQQHLDCWRQWWARKGSISINSFAQIHRQQLPAAAHSSEQEQTTLIKAPGATNCKQSSRLNDCFLLCYLCILSRFTAATVTKEIAHWKTTAAQTMYPADCKCVCAQCQVISQFLFAEKAAMLVSALLTPWWQQDPDVQCAMMMMMVLLAVDDKRHFRQKSVHSYWLNIVCSRKAKAAAAMVTNTGNNGQRWYIYSFIHSFIHLYFVYLSTYLLLFLYSVCAHICTGHLGGDGNVHCRWFIALSSGNCHLLDV